MKVSCGFHTVAEAKRFAQVRAYSKPHASRADPSWWSCSRTPSRPHPTPHPMAYRTLGRAAEQLRSGHDTGHQRTKLRTPASIFSPRIRRTLGLKRARRATDQPSSQLMVAETVESRWLRTKSCRRTTRCHSHARTAGTRHARPLDHRLSERQQDGTDLPRPSQERPVDRVTCRGGACTWRRNAGGRNIGQGPLALGMSRDYDEVHNEESSLVVTTTPLFHCREPSSSARPEPISTRLKQCPTELTPDTVPAVNHSA